MQTEAGRGKGSPHRGHRGCVQACSGSSRDRAEVERTRPKSDGEGPGREGWAWRAGSRPEGGARGGGGARVGEGGAQRRGRGRVLRPAPPLRDAPGIGAAKAAGLRAAPRVRPPRSPTPPRPRTPAGLPPRPPPPPEPQGPRAVCGERGAAAGRGRAGVGAAGALTVQVVLQVHGSRHLRRGRVQGLRGRAVPRERGWGGAACSLFMSRAR
jgi:hypothetical protein